MSLGKAHPDDLLVVAWVTEAKEWPEFDPRQVVTVNNVAGLRGRKVRHIYQTVPAMWNMKPEMMHAIDVARVTGGGEIRDARNWRPEPQPTRWQRLRKGLLDLCERFAA